MDIDAIKAMLTEITQGEWRADVNENNFLEIWVDNCNLAEIGKIEYLQPHERASAAFIAAAPSIVRILLQKIDELEAENSELSSALSSWYGSV